MEPENPVLDEFVISVARTSCPRVCFIPTASGDAEAYVARFYRSFSALDCRMADLQLFQRTVEDLEAFVLAQDVIYVGGGNTASMLAVWRVHDLDRVLARAWADGVVLCGLSAGMNCWFEESVPSVHPLGRDERGLGSDDGAALVFSGTTLDEVVSSRLSASAYLVEKANSGVGERRLEAHYLG